MEVDEREDMYEIEDENFNNINLDGNFDKNNDSSELVLSDKNVINAVTQHTEKKEKEEKTYETTENKLRQTNPFYNNSKKKVVNSKNGEITIKKSAMSKKNLNIIPDAENSPANRYLNNNNLEVIQLTVETPKDHNEIDFKQNNNKKGSGAVNTIKNTPSLNKNKMAKNTKSSLKSSDSNFIKNKKEKLNNLHLNDVNTKSLTSDSKENMIVIQNKNPKTNVKAVNYGEVLKKNTESVNPNVSSLAKSKINWEKQIRDQVSAEKDKNKENKAFCIWEASTLSNNMDQEDSNCLITKGERIYMKNMAEKTLKLILEEKERRKKLKENSESASFTPSLHLTAYRKPQGYNVSHHLLETTCYKNKTVFSKPDSDCDDDVKIEDEIELMKRERKTAPIESIQKYAERLHKDHEARQINKVKNAEKFYNEICTFTPEVNDKTEPNQKNFYERLQGWIVKQKEREEERKELFKLNETTNKPFFKPLTSDSTLELKDRPKNSQELLSKLHDDYKQKIEKRTNLHQNNLKKVREDSEKPLTSPNSKELNEKNKAELFTRIFEILDYNQDKKISYDEDFEEAMKEVPKHIVKILEPLFEEFKENKEVLTIKEFVLSCGRLYNILSFWERSELFNYIFQLKKATSSRHQKVQSNMESHKRQFSPVPNINDKSKEIFSQSKKYSDTDFMNRNVTYKVNRESNLKQGQEKIIAKEKEGKKNKFNYIFIVI